jgi:hypothetical protein
MPRLRRTARKSVRNFHDAPYQLSIRAGEPIPSYVRRLRICMENCHWNKYYGNSDYNTLPKQADVLIKTLSDVGPYAELKKEYNDIIKNGRPNWERYTDEDGEWFLTLEYLEGRMNDAKAKWLYNVPSNSYAYEDDSDGGDDTTYTIPILIQSEDEKNYEPKGDYEEDPEEDPEEDSEENFEEDPIQK